MQNDPLRVLAVMSLSSPPSESSLNTVLRTGRFRCLWFNWTKSHRIFRRFLSFWSSQDRVRQGVPCHWNTESSSPRTLLDSPHPAVGKRHGCIAQADRQDLGAVSYRRKSIKRKATGQHRNPRPSVQAYKKTPRLIVLFAFNCQGEIRWLMRRHATIPTAR